MTTNAPTTATQRDLQALHDFYVEAVNIAVADDDLDRIDSLTSQYDVEAFDLMRRAA